MSDAGGPKRPSFAVAAVATTDSITPSTTVSVASGETTNTIQDLLLSLPPLEFDTETSTILNSVDTSMPELLDLDTTITEVIPDHSLPQTPLPVAELDKLTSNSKFARRISLMDAVCRALDANQVLRIEKLRPEVANTAIESAAGEFDPVFESGVSKAFTRTPRLGPQGRSNGGSDRDSGSNTATDIDLNAGVSGRLPTGTNYALGFNANRGVTNSTFPFYNNGLNLNITQNLLRGAGCDVNLVRVWTAQNNYVFSLYQLQQVLIDLVTDVQNTYWDVYLALKTLEIRRTAHRVAREQRERAEEFVRVGRAAPLDALSAQAEEATRVSEVINAAAELKQQELAFLRLISPESLSTAWYSLMYPSEAPILPTEKLDPEERVRLAHYYRPDLRQGQIDLANGELETIRTENGLLPALDLITDFGLTGSGDNLKDSLGKLPGADFRSYRVGLQFSVPLQNRIARAAHRRATFQKQSAEEAIRNYCQLIEQDVRTAIIEIEGSAQLVESTIMTERLREREYEAELEKFRVGRSTQLAVSQIHRDLIQAQVDTVRVQVANVQFYLKLYRVEGTALLRRGIEPIYIKPESLDPGI